MAQHNYPTLSFPPIRLRARRTTEGRTEVFDRGRGRWLVLTPEEWVRQHTIAWLVSAKGVPSLRISQEYPVNINGQHQRADIVVVDNFAKPYILVECKAPNIDIDNEVVIQAIRYNAVVQAQYVLLTNGKELYCFEYADGKYRAVKKF